MSTGKLIASWRSVKPEENRSRFYPISLSENLWGEEVLVKRWGRIGERKKENYIWPNSHRLMDRIDEIKEQRSRHGCELERGVMAN